MLVVHQAVGEADVHLQEEVVVVQVVVPGAQVVAQAMVPGAQVVAQAVVPVEAVVVVPVVVPAESVLTVELEGQVVVPVEAVVVEQEDGDTTLTQGTRCTTGATLPHAGSAAFTIET